MFNIGPMELIVILLVALIVVGPKRLPEVGRSIGKSLRELRRASDEVRYSFETSLDDEPPETVEAEAAKGAKAGRRAKRSREADGSSPNGSEPQPESSKVPDED
jgi:sec-independent protein translocase protein TatA